MNKFEFKNLTPFKWFVLENFPFIEADFDALTEWQLFCKIGKEINKIIDSQNVVGTEMEKFSQAFIELQNYVDNYFKNLDVQDEINNKLNEMTEDGTLQEIISAYLNSKAIFGFDNVESMKNSTNLIDGSYAKTLGFYNKNDGGSAFYKIRSLKSGESPDNMFTIKLNNSLLIAELVIKSNSININSLGAKSDDSFDNYTIIQTAINYCINNKLILLFGSGTYCFSGIIDVKENQNGITIIGTNEFTTIIKSLDNDSQFKFRNFLRSQIKNIKFSSTGTENIPLLDFTGVCHLSEIVNCTFESNMCVNISGTSAYFKFEDCSFSRKSSLPATSNVNYLLKMTSSANEYFYLKNVYFEGISSTADCSPVQILGGHNIYIDDCDFCNWFGGNGLTLGGSASLKDIYINHSTFVRNKISIKIAVDYGLTNLSLNDNDFILLTGNEEFLIYVDRTPGTIGIGRQINGLNNIDSNHDLTNKNMLYCPDNLITPGNLKLMSVNNSYPQYSLTFPVKYEIMYNKLIRVLAGSDQTSVDIKLLDKSPFTDDNLPTLKWYKINGLAPKEVKLINEKNGELKIHFDYGSSTGAYTVYLITLNN